MPFAPLFRVTVLRFRGKFRSGRDSCNVDEFMKRARGSDLMLIDIGESSFDGTTWNEILRPDRLLNSRKRPHIRVIGALASHPAQACGDPRVFFLPNITLPSPTKVSGVVWEEFGLEPLGIPAH